MLETYWKMQNSFQLRTKKNNPFSLYMQKLHSLSDEQLNNLTVEEWDELSYETEEKSDFLSKFFKLKETYNDWKDKVPFLSYKESLEIDYPNISSNNSFLISFCLFFLNLIDETQIIKVIEFINKISNEIILINRSDSKHKKSLDLSFNIIDFEKDDLWIIDILKDFNLYGYKIILINENGLILPFWDWTFDLLFKSINKKLFEINYDIHSKLIENIISLLIKKWEPEHEFYNLKFSINNVKGEVDFAFIKNKILYVFENKNILEFSNPIEKNKIKFEKWIDQYYYKGIKQLNKIRKNAKKIFKNVNFEKFIPVLCTSSRNRFEPFLFSKKIKENEDDMVFLDLDSLLFILNLKYGYELIIFYSYFFSTNLCTGLFDFVDIAGNFIDLKEKEIFSKLEILNHKIDFHKSYLKEIFQGILLNFNKKATFIVMKWTGNYRTAFYFLLSEAKEEKFLFNKTFMNILFEFNNSEIIKILKFIFKGDTFYNKKTKTIDFKYDDKC